LRDHLFATLEALRDKESPMDIERAKAISTVANTIIESAKVEHKFMELTGGEGTGFVPRPKLEGPRTATIAKLPRAGS
jgi:hypothetical protein